MTSQAPGGTTRQAPRPRILGFGSEPVLPREGGFWKLPTGAGTLTLVTDAKEALVALFHRSSGEVMHAVYTDSTYLSCLLHAAVVDATILNRDAAALCTGSFNKMLFGLIPGGFLELIEGERRQARARGESEAPAPAG